MDICDEEVLLGWERRKEEVDATIGSRGREKICE